MAKKKKTGIDIKLLSEICETPGAPGFEQRIRRVVLREIGKLADQITTDNLGNVTAIRKGKITKGKKNKKVMIAAHMDEIGFIATHIDNNGFVKFHTLGGFDPKTLTAQRVIIHGKKDVIGVMGSKPVHLMSNEERGKAVKTDDFFIDLGMGKAAVEEIVTVGDSITRERALIEMGDCVNCKSIDNRVSVYILIEALREMKETNVDMYAVFTVQEEVGLRGSFASALQIQPDFGIGLDTTIAFDVPGARDHEMITKLGKGAAIKIMDASTICDFRMVDFMKKTATKHNIQFQTEILTAGGTDTAGMQRNTAGGAIAGAISIPTRHIHQVIETANKEDIRACIELLKACLEDMHTYDWSHN
ncbi:MAG: M20/M25/M40 family metallo-hydrolase [Bacteroidetes bacterium]|nr:M20/M25/M40 family metallo-hydrolase [Bacteroidota bacterium]